MSIVRYTTLLLFDSSLVMLASVLPSSYTIFDETGLSDSC